MLRRNPGSLIHILCALPLETEDSAEDVAIPFGLHYTAIYCGNDIRDCAGEDSASHLH